MPNEAPTSGYSNPSANGSPLGRKTASKGRATSAAAHRNRLLNLRMANALSASALRAGVERSAGGSMPSRRRLPTSAFSAVAKSQAFGVFWGSGRPGFVTSFRYGERQISAFASSSESTYWYPVRSTSCLAGRRTETGSALYSRWNTISPSYSQCHTNKTKLNPHSEQLMAPAIIKVALWSGPNDGMPSNALRSLVPGIQSLPATALLSNDPVG